MLKPFLSAAASTVPRLTKAERGHLLNLSSNELLHPDLGPLLEKPLRALDASSVAAYPTYAKTIRRLAEHHAVDPSCLLISAGSDDGIRLVIEALAASVGSIALQTPNYEGWRRHADLRGIQVHEIRFGQDRPDAFTLDQFRTFLETAKPTLIAISNPNSPTGFTFTTEELTELSAICGRHGHLFVLDECYATFAGGAPLPRCADHEIRIQTFSKGYGLAGGRIACLIAAPAISDYLARFRPENAVSGPAMQLACAVVDMNSALSVIRADVMNALPLLLANVLRVRPAWSPLSTGGNFVNFRTQSDFEVASTAKALEARGIRVKNTSSEVGLDRCLRVSLADWSIMQRLCQTLADLPQE